MDWAYIYQLDKQESILDGIDQVLFGIFFLLTNSVNQSHLKCLNIWEHFQPRQVCEH